MLKEPPILRLLLAAAPLAAASVRVDLLERQSSNCVSGFSQCQNSGLPSNFCCPTGTGCDVLAGNTTVLCCPTGRDCSEIVPIICDLNQQNATAHPDAPIKTTALGGTLGVCGDGTCCPFGYSCTADKTKCEKNADQNSAPPQNSSALPHSSTSASSSSTATTTATAALTTTVAGSNSDPASQDSTGGDSTNSNQQTLTIVGGVLGGVIGLLVVGLCAWVFARRHKKDDQKPALNKHGSTSSFGNFISNPVTISSPKVETEGSAYRTDFIRKSPLATPNSTRTAARRPPSPFVPAARHHSDLDGYNTPDRSRPTTPRDSARVPPLRGNWPPGTPPAQREPSQEINIFADPTTVGRGRRDSEDRKTTFTDIMEEADLSSVRRGKPYVPSSLQSSPASRRS